jgi:hypothetical protein
VNVSWWRKLVALFRREARVARGQALLTETCGGKSSGYREQASIATAFLQQEGRRAIEALIASYEMEAQQLDVRALEHLDKATLINGEADRAVASRRSAQVKRELVADLRKRAGLV